MSGETHRDDQQPSDDLDDFILEDAPPPDELEELFTDAARPKQARNPQEDAEEDVLFDATATPGPEAFPSERRFEEEGGPQWKGHRLSADEIGIPTDDVGSDDQAAAPPSFAAQLGELLSREQEGNEDFAVDEPDLQLVSDDSELVPDEGATVAAAGATAVPGDDADAGVDDETFVVADEASELQPPTEEVTLDADEPLQLEPAAATATPTDAPAEEELEFETVEAEAAAEPVADATGADQPAAADGEPVEGEDWALAPSEEVAAAAAAAAAAGDADAEAAEEVGAEHSELQRSRFARGANRPFAAVEEGELVAAGSGGRVIGAPVGRRHTARILSSLAAAVLLFGGGAVAWLRPEWIGLPNQPELVQRVVVARPELPIDVPAPPPPVTAAETPAVTPPEPQPTTPDPTSTATGDPAGQTEPSTGAATTPPVEPKPPADSTTVVDGPPIQITPNAEPRKGEEILQSEDLGIGSFQNRPAAGLPALAVVPGSRAFAQLRNGNFFIGTVKSVGDADLVMKLEKGEVTLARLELGKVMPLGSSEYGELVKTVNGKLKLRNQNRFVGTILEGIADDHIILEMKSDRVVLPKSAIEEIVAEDTKGVRLGHEDDDTWMRKLVERQLQEEAAAAERRAREEKLQAQREAESAKNDGAIVVDKKPAPKAVKKVLPAAKPATPPATPAPTPKKK